MNRKPTYKELEKKIAELAKKIAELEGSKKAIQRSEARLKEAERIAKIGHWELDLVTNTLYWSDEIYRIFDSDPQKFGATYEAFIDSVHPEDRKAVDKAFTDSVKKRTGLDIVHRLLLKNDTLKYIHEKCRTIYDVDGKPLRSLGTVQDITELKQKKDSFSGIIGRDPKMKNIFEMIREITEVEIPVLIQGESGTGKELVARAIHNEGPRVQKAFVPVNCGALPEGLLESELFGHVKGSFTGALRDRKGRFEMANGGTLFLDEIADLSKVMQAKLLRVLQEGKFEQVGGEKTISVDVRIISAANRNLKHEVEKGNFRDDLYYRISVVPIHMPPLRKRKNDIPLLVNNFLEKVAYKGQKTKTISESALSVIIDYPWPGNVRELQSAIHYSLIKSRGKIILPVHLPMELRNQKINRLSRGPSLRLDSKIVKEALIRSGGNKAKAARYLGVGRATLYRFLKNFPDIASNIYESE
jgi:sigma-54 dependent transcriptional regulator, acetoin dehydrogenase operon transcriptional activator AcoR